MGYESSLRYNERTKYFELSFTCDKINDAGYYDQLTKIDLEVLRDNARDIFTVIERKLENS